MRGFGASPRAVDPASFSSTRESGRSGRSGYARAARSLPEKLQEDGEENSGTPASPRDESLHLESPCYALL